MKAINGHIISGTSICVDYWHWTPDKKFHHFLTHLHADHTVGLKSTFREKIHTSSFNGWLLRRWFDINPECIVTYDVGTSHMFDDETSNSRFCVTLLDANHCPGSVMFLFQGNFGNILYTGDFRYYPQILEQPMLKSLIENEAVDRLYLDNTFAAEHCEFPPRHEALKEIINVIKDHPDHSIILGVRKLGKEEALRAIALELKEKIYVSAEKLSILTYLGYENVFTRDPEESRIFVKQIPHITPKRIDEVRAERGPVVTILLTALYAVTPPKYKCSISADIEKGIYKIPYSDHSCHSELVEFVSKIKPKELLAIVNTFEESRVDSRKVGGLTDDILSCSWQNSVLPKSITMFSNLRCGNKSLETNNSLTFGFKGNIYSYFTEDSSDTSGDNFEASKTVLWEKSETQKNESEDILKIRNEEQEKKPPGITSKINCSAEVCTSQTKNKEVCFSQKTTSSVNKLTQDIPEGDLEFFTMSQGENSPQLKKSLDSGQPNVENKQKIENDQDVRDNAAAVKSVHIVSKDMEESQSGLCQIPTNNHNTQINDVNISLRTPPPTRIRKFFRKCIDSTPYWHSPEVEQLYMGEDVGIDNFESANVNIQRNMGEDKENESEYSDDESEECEHTILDMINEKLTPKRNRSPEVYTSQTKNEEACFSQKTTSSVNKLTDIPEGDLEFFTMSQEENSPQLKESLDSDQPSVENKQKLDNDEGFRDNAVAVKSVHIVSEDMEESQSGLCQIPTNNQNKQINDVNKSSCTPPPTRTGKFFRKCIVSTPYRHRPEVEQLYRGEDMGNGNFESANLNTQRNMEEDKENEREYSDDESEECEHAILDMIIEKLESPEAREKNCSFAQCTSSSAHTSSIAHSSSSAHTSSSAHKLIRKNCVSTTIPKAEDTNVKGDEKQCCVNGKPNSKNKNSVEIALLSLETQNGIKTIDNRPHKLVCNLENPIKKFLCDEVIEQQTNKNQAAVCGRSVLFTPNSPVQTNKSETLQINLAPPTATKNHQTERNVGIKNNSITRMNINGFKNKHVLNDNVKCSLKRKDDLNNLQNNMGEKKQIISHENNVVRKSNNKKSERLMSKAENRYNNIHDSKYLFPNVIEERNSVLKRIFQQHLPAEKPPVTKTVCSNNLSGTKSSSAQRVLVKNSLVCCRAAECFFNEQSVHARMLILNRIFQPRSTTIANMQSTESIQKTKTSYTKIGASSYSKVAGCYKESKRRKCTSVSNINQSLASCRPTPSNCKSGQISSYEQNMDCSLGQVEPDSDSTVSDLEDNIVDKIDKWHCRNDEIGKSRKNNPSCTDDILLKYEHFVVKRFPKKLLAKDFLAPLPIVKQETGIVGSLLDQNKANEPVRSSFPDNNNERFNEAECSVFGDENCQQGSNQMNTGHRNESRKKSFDSGPNMKQISSKILIKQSDMSKEDLTRFYNNLPSIYKHWKKQVEEASRK